MNTSTESFSKLILAAGVLACIGLAANAQSTQFLPGRLAVLRAGDGQVALHLKQAPIFIDQFDPNVFNAAPSFTVAVPTNGPNAFFFNGHAATEGNLARSADHATLTFAGFCGDLLQTSGTPSQLEIPRGICSVDVTGAKCSIVYRGRGWYGKTNPRSAVTDGANNFWGAGNVDGVVYYNPSTTPEPLAIESYPNIRNVKIFNNVLYASLNGADGINMNVAPGVYNSTVDSKPSLPRPKQDATRMNLVVASSIPYTKNVGFDLNPEGTIAYMTDTASGIQKYVKTGGAWKFAYNFAMPRAIPAEANHGAGCFGLAVDFGGSAPIIYATTTEGYGNGVNSNRVVRITDTNASAAVVTIAQAGSTNVAFRGLDFTPQPAGRRL